MRPEDARVQWWLVGLAAAIGKSWAAQFPTPRRSIALNKTPSARPSLLSIVLGALFQLDPLNLPDCFAGPLSPRHAALAD